jgi:hypothetical protein
MPCDIAEYTRRGMITVPSCTPRFPTQAEFAQLDAAVARQSSTVADLSSLLAIGNESEDGERLLLPLGNKVHNRSGDGWSHICCASQLPASLGGRRMGNMGGTVGVPDATASVTSCNQVSSMDINKDSTPWSPVTPSYLPWRHTHD